MQDELVFIHPDTTEFPGYVRFDTAHIPCRMAIKNEFDKETLRTYALGGITLKDARFRDPNLELLRTILVEEIAPHRVRLIGEVVQPDEYADLSPDEKKLLKSFYIFEVSRVRRPLYKK